MKQRRQRVATGRLLAFVALAGAGLMSLTSCGLADVSMSAVMIPTPTSTATLSITPTVGDTEVLPGSPVRVQAQQGRLTSVKVVSADGTPLRGTLSGDSRSWVSVDHAVGYGAMYFVEAAAIDREGLSTSKRVQFSTMVPDRTAAVQWSEPMAGSTFGVGIPLTLTFDRDIEFKADVESNLVVITPTSIEGAWRWLSDNTVQYRPKTYWPGNIDITVKANLLGVQTGPDVWGEKDASYVFHTSDSIVGRVDMNKYTLTVRRNGTVIRTIPITTGKPGFESRSGVKVVLTKERTRLMDAATGGTDPTSPEYYRLTVEYAMRLTWSGEFLHAAPWSEGSQGYDNVSHGCTGMSTSNAEWLYGISGLGDVYEFVGNDKQMGTGDNGITVWNVPWYEWLEDSRIDSVMTTEADQSLR